MFTKLLGPNDEYPIKNFRTTFLLLTRQTINRSYCSITELEMVMGLVIVMGLINGNGIGNGNGINKW